MARGEHDLAQSYDNKSPPQKLPSPQAQVIEYQNIEPLVQIDLKRDLNSSGRLIPSKKACHSKLQKDVMFKDKQLDSTPSFKKTDLSPKGKPLKVDLTQKIKH